MLRRSLGEVFEQWVAGGITAPRRVAFLKDTTIYVSVVEHLQEEAGHVAAFVSKDTDFDEEFMRRLTPPGVRVEPYPGLAPLLGVLRRGLHLEIRRQIDEDQRRAQAALEDRRDDLERFINATLQVPENYLTFPRIVAFRGATVVGILGALTTRLGEEHPKGRVAISAQVAVKLHLLVEGQLHIPDRAMKAGEEVPPRYLEILSATLGRGAAEPPAEERVEEAVVSVEATAALRDGNYEDIQFVSASLVSQIFASLFRRT